MPITKHPAYGHVSVYRSLNGSSSSLYQTSGVQRSIVTIEVSESELRPSGVSGDSPTLMPRAGKRILRLEMSAQQFMELIYAPNAGGTCCTLTWRADLAEHAISPPPKPPTEREVIEAQF